MRLAKSLFFVRYAFDTNEDGKIDINDHPQIWQIPFDAGKAFAASAPLAMAWPVTPEGNYDLFPRTAGGRLFYSSDDGVNSDIWAVPEAGILSAKTVRGSRGKPPKHQDDSIGARNLTAEV